MSSIYEYDNDPLLYHERANKLRAWAAEISSDKIRAELRSLADEYDRHAETELQRRTKTIFAVRSAASPFDGRL
jgi:hypothetical protein